MNREDSQDRLNLNSYVSCVHSVVIRVLLLTALLVVAAPAFAQPPVVLKIDPPSWWTRSTINPVRLLINGRHLSNARVQSADAGVRVVGVPEINSAGTYIFVDVFIAPWARSGVRRLKVTTQAGSTDAHFEVFPALNRARRFQGFSPDDILYLIMIDRFRDGDQSNNDPPESRGIYDRKNKFYYHGGDLQGVIDGLPYLKDLGVTAIWLTPWYDNYNRPNEIELKEKKPSTGFHGYNPQDFYAVEEHFGTMAKLRELIEAAHRAEIKIIEDQVVNHTGPYHPWVDDSPTPTWFNGTRRNHLKNVFQTWVLHDPRPVEGLRRETMEGWFLDFLPDLNQHDPEVSRYLIQNTLWWIGTTGLDGIRMDTWQYVPNEFWRDWNKALKREFPNFVVAGEVKDGDAVHTSYFQGGRPRNGVDSGLQSLLDFPLFYSLRHAFAEGKAIDEIPKTLSKDFLYTQPDLLVTLLGGHDDGRFMSENGATIDGLKLANTFVLTTRGIPQLYYGDEIAMTGQDEPTTRQDFPGGFPGDKRNAFIAAGRTREENEVFNAVRELNRLRAELDPLRRGELINLHASEEFYVYARKTAKDFAIVAINNSKNGSSISFNVGPLGLKDGMQLRDRLLHVRTVQVRQGKVEVGLPAKTAVILVRQ